MDCNNCGHSFYGNYCPKCGNKYEDHSSKTETQQENPYNVYYDNTDSNNNQQYYEPYYQQEQVETAPPLNDETRGFRATTTPQSPTHCCFMCPFLVCSRYNNPYGFYNNHPPINTTPTYPVNIEDKKKTWTPGKIIATVIASIVIFSVITTILPGLLFGSALYMSTSNPTSVKTQTGYSLGDTATEDYFAYTLKEFKEISEYNKTKPKEGYKFVEITFLIKNTSEYKNTADCEIDLYVDDVQINSVDYDADYGIYENVLPGKYINAVSVFEIPVDSNNIEVCLSPFDSGSSYMFTIK